MSYLRTYCYSQGGRDRDILLLSTGFPVPPLLDDPKAYTGGSYRTSSETRRNSDESCGRDCFCSSPARTTKTIQVQNENTCNPTHIANKKVLLRERKRHIARRVAVARACYSGGGGPSAKIFFSSLNMYQAKSGVKNFSLYWGGGPSVKIFFPV